MIYYAGSGHPGGSLSCVELLVALVEQELGWQDYDFDKRKNRLVLSKGHACPALYAVAMEYGLVAKEEAIHFRQIDSILQGHPHIETTPWVETSTGSLGQGFSVALGMAYGLRVQNDPSRVYAILGDGELQEGQVWEAAMWAAHYQVSNLCALIDYNKMQSDDLNKNTMGLEPLADKWRAFGWNVIEIDGHDFSQIYSAIDQCKVELERPSVIIAHTIKGKGISYMEDVPVWHGSVKLKEEEFLQALADLQTTPEHCKLYLEGYLNKL